MMCEHARATAYACGARHEHVCLTDATVTSAVGMARTTGNNRFFARSIILPPDVVPVASCAAPCMHNEL
eukprot:6193681-Pleurochrysis_carterae.AAC.1